MIDCNRREVLKMGGFALVANLVGGRTMSKIHINSNELTFQQNAVKFTRDGIDMTPLEYSSLLLELANERKIKVDNYSLGGTIEELEHKFAKWLGKESAIFMPTGTLANQIAIRKLAGKKKKAIVQAESHVYNDTGDCLQRLSGINLVPVGKNKATVTLNEIEETISKTKTARVATQVGVISIESPVRRKYEELFDFEEMKKICSYARNTGIKLHLDGARLFIASAHTGITPSEYSTQFETVYISLYKCFNAASGAILAGSRKFINNLFNMRRMFGGGLVQVWPFAAVALHYVDTFIEEYSKAQKKAERFFRLLQENSSFKVEKIPNGTIVFKLHVSGTNLHKFREKLEQKNIHIPPPQENWNGFVMKTNVTLNRTNADSLTKEFIAAL